MMDDTGRLRRALTPRARTIVFGEQVDHAIAEELPFYITVDRAHLVMLVERGIIARTVAQRLLDAMHMLVAQGFAPLRGRPAPRGLYLLYEHYLIESLGEETGGALHIGRSRNDLNATVLLLRLRSYFSRLMREALRLQAALIERAGVFAQQTMPSYTHHQAAVPITYGHYLAGIAVALERDLNGLAAAAAATSQCPLGAGAAGGTSVPIDPARTAQLLGFTRAVQHSVDAVASRDVVLRLLAAGTCSGITLSRLSSDLQLWSTAEFDLIHFPDDLVGSSSMMPQKRNAFLLEHIKGRSGAPLGAFVAAATAMHATPFSNSIAVGTEAVKYIWSALDELTEASVLMRLVVRHAEPQTGNMYRRALAGFTTATELANQLVLRAGVPFRRAHHLVGELVNRTSATGESLQHSAAALLAENALSEEAISLDPAQVAERSAYGGGPASGSVHALLDGLTLRWTSTRRQLRVERNLWSSSSRALDLAVSRIQYD